MSRMVGGGHDEGSGTGQMAHGHAVAVGRVGGHAVELGSGGGPAGAGGNGVELEILDGDVVSTMEMEKFSLSSADASKFCDAFSRRVAALRSRCAGMPGGTARASFCECARLRAIGEHVLAGWRASRISRLGNDLISMVPHKDKLDPRDLVVYVSGGAEFSSGGHGYSPVPRKAVCLHLAHRALHSCDKEDGTSQTLMCDCHRQGKNDQGPFETWFRAQAKKLEVPFSALALACRRATSPCARLLGRGLAGAKLLDRNLKVCFNKKCPLLALHGDGAPRRINVPVVQRNRLGQVVCNGQKPILVVSNVMQRDVSAACLIGWGALCRIVTGSRPSQLSKAGIDAAPAPSAFSTSAIDSMPAEASFATGEVDFGQTGSVISSATPAASGRALPY